MPIKKIQHTLAADYSLFFQFIAAFAKDGFTGIDPNHPLMLELEKMMEANKQFFYIS